mmetsp:Transcript_113639/g.253584  ORF Transcript_113639/g.253584 Transcript_113639/m.253584 type:complete len:202 (+) Transcript_113639:21-626(+)
MVPGLLATELSSLTLGLELAGVGTVCLGSQRVTATLALLKLPRHLVEEALLLRALPFCSGCGASSRSQCRSCRLDAFLQTSPLRFEALLLERHRIGQLLVSLGESGCAVFVVLCPQGRDSGFACGPQLLYFEGVGAPQLRRYFREPLIHQLPLPGSLSRKMSGEPLPVSPRLALGCREFGADPLRLVPQVLYCSAPQCLGL